MARLSLRARARLLVVVVALAPACIAMLAGGAERVQTWFVWGRVRSAGRELLLGGDPSVIARDEDVRVRVYEGEEPVLSAVGPTADGWFRWVGAGFFGGDVFPSFAEWDAESPEPLDGCVVGLERRALVCGVSVTLPDGRLAAADAILRRHVLYLSDDLFAVVELVSVSALVGLGLSAWMGRRIVLDVERLSRRAEARPAAPLERTGIAELDAFVDLGNARLATQARRAADLAHELKGPAAVLRAAAEAIPAGERGDRLRRSLDEAGRRVDQVATGFLALARAEAGLSSEVRERVDLLAMARGLAASREGVRVGEGSYVVNGVPPAFETLLANLIDNGMATGASVLVVQDGEALVVSDDGPGVPEANRARVFDAWFTTRERGTGLGLALARAIAEAHGGSLTLREGSRFVLEVPREG